MPAAGWSAAMTSRAVLGDAPLAAAGAPVPALPSMGMDSGVPPVPRATGETLRASRAETVHASMSMVEAAEAVCWCEALTTDGGAAAVLVGGGDAGGGGTAL